MKHPVEELRLFKKTDEEMLQQSDVLLDSFQENKSQFVLRFPALADPFVVEWGQATATARAAIPDYVAVAEQASETIELENLMDQGRNLLQTVILYAKIAFPGNTTVLQLFGQSQYDGARDSHLKLPVLLRSTFTEASKPEYKKALIAKGLTGAEINSLNSLAESITLQTAVQQNAMKDRLLATNQRINLMNDVWEKMSLVCQCAKLVFQDDAAKYNLFVLTDGETTLTNDISTPPVER